MDILAIWRMAVAVEQKRRPQNKRLTYLLACLLSLTLSPRRDAALTFGNEKHFFRCKTFLERRAEAEEEGAAELCVFPRPSERLRVRGRERDAGTAGGSSLLGTRRHAAFW